MTQQMTQDDAEQDDQESRMTQSRMTQEQDDAGRMTQDGDNVIK